MPPKNAKIWNEDLVMALRAREEMARQQGKQRQFLWRDGAQVIEGVRNDIYVFKSGRVVGLPHERLKKTVLDTCNKILKGEEPVLPDGYAPSSHNEQGHFGGVNPYESHPYLQRIKIRGGAFAILMAFHVCCSQRQSMTKEQIIRAAQDFCDEAMEGNFNAGRPIGAWKGHETLVKHGLLLVQKARVAYNERAGGLRAMGKNSYALSRDGEQFIEALLLRHPEIMNQSSALKGARRDPESSSFVPETPVAAVSSDLPFHVVSVSRHEDPVVPFEGQGRCLDSTPSKRLRTLPAGLAAADAAIYRHAIFQSLEKKVNLVQTVTPAKAAKSPNFARGLKHEVDVIELLETPLSIVSREKRPAFVESDKKISAKSQRKLNFDGPHVLELIDSDLDDERKSSNSVESDKKPVAKSQQRVNLDRPEVLTLLDSDTDEDDILISSGPTFRQKRENVMLSETSSSVNAVGFDLPSLGNGVSFSILVDSRERNRNCTPRFLRTELTRLVSTGPLHVAWPETVPKPEIEEICLTFGDFNFVRKVGERAETIPVMVERKRIGDLVQRSATRDHWGQLQRMRDRRSLSVLLLEGDFRTAAAFEAFGSPDDWRKTDHVIDDENSLLRFIGRAILSSEMIRFIQTKDEQESLRAVAAIGLVAAASVVVPSTDNRNPYKKRGNVELLSDRLESGGIPREVAKDLSKEIGSAMQLDKIYSEIDDEECREQVLAPYLEDAREKVDTESSAHSWSRAIHSVYFSTFANTHQAKLCYEQCGSFVTDRAALLRRIHRGEPPEDAVNSSFISDNDIDPRRIVHIDLPSHLKGIFTDDTDKAFYSAKVSPKKDLVVMQTKDELFESEPLNIFLLEGKHVADLLRTAMNERPTCYGSSLYVAAQLNKECNISGLNGGGSSSFSRRVIVIRGLRPALEHLAKQPGYKSEIRFTMDLMLAHLMVSHGIVVLHAVRKGDCRKDDSENDQCKILRSLALACFHFQLLTKKRITSKDYLPLGLDPEE